MLLQVEYLTHCDLTTHESPKNIPFFYPKLLYPVHGKNKIYQGTPHAEIWNGVYHNQHCQKAATFGPEPI